MTTLPFRIEYHHPDGQWFTTPGDQDTSLLYLRGYLAARREHSPRLPARIVRDRDGKVMDEDPGSDAPRVGMVAGYATAGQLIRAAVSALRQVRPVDPDDIYAPAAEEADRVKAALRVLDVATAEGAPDAR